MRVGSLGTTSPWQQDMGVSRTTTEGQGRGLQAVLVMVTSLTKEQDI